MKLRINKLNCRITFGMLYTERDSLPHFPTLESDNGISQNQRHNARQAIPPPQKIYNTMIYGHIDNAVFQNMQPEEFHVKVAKKAEEITKLLKTGFKYVCKKTVCYSSENVNDKINDNTEKRKLLINLLI